MKNPRIIIIGAGPCGLGAAWRLTELGKHNFQVYEKEDHVGGLASSYIDQQGFTWDVGGHVLHSHYAYFDAVFEKVMDQQYSTHERASWIWSHNRFIPYPFQNNIYRLPPSIRDQCLAGLKKVASQKSTTIANFADWIRASYGEGIARDFMLPYNEKVWAYPLDKMSYTWVADRVAPVNVQRIEDNIRLHRDDVSWGPNATFRFPKRGGTGAIWKNVASYFSRHISLNKQVVRIDSRKRHVYFSDDTHDTYDLLLTSLPLDQLTQIVADVSLPKSNPLVYSQVSVVGIGIYGSVPDALRHKCWMYFPQSTTPFFRATVFSNYSKYNAPHGTWSLMTETAWSHYLPKPTGDIKEHVLAGALRTKLIPPGSKIVSTWDFETAHGYPTPTLGRDTYLAEVLPALAAQNIYSRGRFGAWKYEVSNQDHTFMQGVEWVDHVVSNGKEITLGMAS